MISIRRFVWGRVKDREYVSQFQDGLEIHPEDTVASSPMNAPGCVVGGWIQVMELDESL